MEPGALRSALLNNICEELKDELVMHDLPAFFNDLMSLCIKVKERLQARRSQRNYNSHKSVGFLGTGAMAESGSSRAHKGADGEEPMQVASPTLRLQSASAGFRPVSASIAAIRHMS